MSVAHVNLKQISFAAAPSSCIIRPDHRLHDGPASLQTVARNGFNSGPLPIPPPKGEGSTGERSANRRLDRLVRVSQAPNGKHAAATDEKFRGAIRQSLRQSVEAIEMLPLDLISAVAKRILKTYQVDGTVYIFGNGGSASTAEHFVCDLAGASRRGGKRPLSLVAPSAHSSLMTALANDSSYAEVFAAQLDGAISSRDLAIAISASGNSPSVLRAVEVARRSGAFSVGLIGFGGGKLKPLVDVAVVVQSHDYGVVENAHLAIEHAITASFREVLLNGMAVVSEDEAVLDTRTVS